jgi:hypothetical protein
MKAWSRAFDAVLDTPFHGTVRSTWFTDDLTRLADAFRRLPTAEALTAFVARAG